MTPTESQCTPTPRDACAADYSAILALNAASVRVLSPLDEAKLRALHAEAAMLRVVDVDGCPGAFLLALREGCDYASPNYRWFAARYASFLYVDRVVVAAMARGRGLGSCLYEDLFDRARATGVSGIACEYDLEPPNEPSRRFHARFGFREVGREQPAGAAKTVSLQLASLRAASS